MEPQAVISIDPPEIDESMPLNETDKAWIRQEIQAAHKSAGWGKLAALVKEWNGTGAAITILVLVFSQFKSYTEFRVHTNDRLDRVENRLDRVEDRLDNIESALRTIQASSAPEKVLHELASLPPKDLGKNLLALRTVVEQPVNQVKPVAQTLQELRSNLIKVNKDSPDYWPTVLRFIEFASDSLATSAPPKGTPPNIKLRGDIVSNGTVAPRHSVVLLDGGAYVNAKFQDSRIVFTNNPVTFRNVTFINCAFEFPTNVDQPPQFMQQAGHDLLASDLQMSYIAGF
jgi:hypothetical protein